MRMIKPMCHSIPNPADTGDERANEDALEYRVVDECLLLAISDGAGGAGIFCGEWARRITKAQPDKPFDSEQMANDWWLTASATFYQDKSTQLDDADPLAREKFYAEGSYATLLFAWLFIREKRLYYTGAGDTTLFLFRLYDDDYAIHKVFPIATQPDLKAAPQLLNWRRHTPIDWTVHEAGLEDKDMLIICTDALARWLLLQLLSLDTPGLQEVLSETLLADMKARPAATPHATTRALLETLEANTTTEEQFRSFTETLLQSGHLEEDDYSLILLKLSINAN